MLRGTLRWIVLLLGSLPMMAMAGQGLNSLDGFLKEMKTLQGQFVQVQFNADRRETQRSSGTLELSRPGRFRWIYAQPYHQELIADGEFLWVFDQDLDQATQKPLRQALGQAPIMLLMENRPLDEQFILTDLGADQRMDWVELKPRDEVSDFREVKFAFRGRMLARMQLTDAFGQITLIEFSDMKLNPALADKHFQFTPPAGVDVVRALR
ncbi:MAG: outer membrane lipoprotein chaperone LolA [Halothiobacillaceae bacterium]|nr:MAG: outer membrane lipoprotein chaperone LolA [Halothiobacillaceae bacterium]